MPHEHSLAGCMPTPLARYLKALGILRLVAEQKDGSATGHWQGDRFLLGTCMATDELEHFFLEEYRPTPIIAPWNGGSGFYPRDNKAGVDGLAGSSTSRLGPYREVIAIGQRLVGGREKSPKNEEKHLLLSRLRATLPDSALAWLDAAVLLAGDRTEYPPLLGTGGNDGRLDFTNNFMQRIIEVMSPADGRPTALAAAWLRGSLAGSATAGLLGRAIGQFAPGQAGGPNGTTGFEAGSLLNPWDFILMLEGGLLFAGSATRRLESHGNAAPSFPFTVRATGSGSGGAGPADEAASRAEIWLPLWQQPASLPELRILFAEGRITVGRRPAADGLDVARAVGSLGVDRGIALFQRYGFFRRSGKAYLATPLGRFRVSRRPESSLVDQLDRGGWLDILRRFARRDNAPAVARHLVRRLEDEIFALTGGGGRPVVQNLVILLGRIQRILAAGAAFRETVPPMPLLGPEWVSAADDGSLEFRIACALAGLEEMRAYVLPIGAEQGMDRAAWRKGSVRAVWSSGNPVLSLARILERRLLDASRDPAALSPFAGRPVARLDEVLAFLAGETDDMRLAALFNGLVNIRLPPSLVRRSRGGIVQPPAAFRVLLPLYTATEDLHRAGLLPESAHMVLPGTITRLLMSANRHQAGRAVAMAWRRLAMAGMRLPPGASPEPLNIDYIRLAAALLLPLGVSDLRHICRPFLENVDQSTSHNHQGVSHDA